MDKKNNTDQKRIRILDRVDCKLQQQVLKAADRVTVAWPGIVEGF